MFIVLTLVTTFLTTPLTLYVYPSDYRVKVENSSKIVRPESTGQPTVAPRVEVISSNIILSEFNLLEDANISKLNKFRISKIVVLLRDLSSINHLISFVHDISPLNSGIESNYKIDIKVVHLKEFSSRTSHLLEASYLQFNEETNNSFNENELSNSSVILGIMNMFNGLLGNHYTSVSVLSTFKNHILTINDQISEASELLICTIEGNQFLKNCTSNSIVGSDDSDLKLYGKLFHTCKSHFGLLVSNDNKNDRMTSGNIEIYQTDINPPNNKEYKSIFGINSISLIITHDNLLSTSDLLALHIAYKFAFNLSSVDVYICGSSSQTSGFEDQIRSLILKDTNTRLSINYIKDLSELKDGTLKPNSYLDKEMYIISNNLDTENNDSLFSESAQELIDLSNIGRFNVLVIKAAVV